jgi:hypothetical protein
VPGSRTHDNPRSCPTRLDESRTRRRPRPAGPRGAASGGRDPRRLAAGEERPVDERGRPKFVGEPPVWPRPESDSRLGEDAAGTGRVSRSCHGEPIGDHLAADVDAGDLNVPQRPPQPSWSSRPAATTSVAGRPAIKAPRCSAAAAPHGVPTSAVSMLMKRMLSDGRLYALTRGWWGRIDATG